MIQFNKKRGLCAAITTMYGNQPAVERAVFNEMLDQFQHAELSYLRPFGYEDYAQRSANQTQHECPKRLQWAFDHWIDPPDGQTIELTQFYGEWYRWASSEGGVPIGYAIYHIDDSGAILRVRCTKAQYESEKLKDKYTVEETLNKSEK